MTKALQALLTGVFFTFILDFLLFLGIKLHYIDAYDIGVYYNVLFADHQDLLLFALFSLFIGWITIYQRNTMVSLSIVSSLFLLGGSALIPSVGNRVGDAFFRQSNLEITIKPYVYRGDILYAGRNELYFYDTDLKRLITLPKEKK